MTDAIVLTETRALSKELSASNLLPAALRKRPEDILAIVLTGAELGLAPMQAIRGIHIIEGKATLSSDLMGALVKRSDACEFLALVESSGIVATYRTKRKGDPGETVMSFTIDQAKAAGVAGKGTWLKYPDAMLRARCLAAICRAVYPDLCLGLYDSDSGELTAERDITPIDQHVDSIKEQVKAAVAAKADFVDGEIVSAPVVSLGDKIAAVGTLVDLQALIPQLQALSPENQAVIKPIYLARKAALTAGA